MSQSDCSSALSTLTCARRELDWIQAAEAQTSTLQIPRRGEAGRGMTAARRAEQEVEAVTGKPNRVSSPDLQAQIDLPPKPGHLETVHSSKWLLEKERSTLMVLACKTHSFPIA